MASGAPLHAQAPEGWDWSRTVTGPLDDGGEAVAIDTTNGAHYTVGYFQSDGVLDWLLAVLGLSVRGGYDGLIVKSDANGNNVWTITIGQTGEDRCTDVCIGPNGNIYVTGRFSGTNAVFGSGHTMTSAGGTDLFVACYNPSGVLQWKVRGGGAGNDNGSSIAYRAGKVFVTGTITGTGNVADVASSSAVNTTGINTFIAAYDATTGAGLWRVDGANANPSYLNGITADDVRVYAIGQFTGTSYQLYASSATLGPALTTPAGRTENGIVVALDHNGAFIWNVAISDAASGGDKPQALAIANSPGGVFVTGRSHNGTTFPGNTTVNASGNPHDYAYIARLSKVNGTTTWVRTLRSTAGGGSDHMQAGRDLAVDANGDVCVIGSFRQALELPNGSTLNGTSDKQVFVAKFGAMGAFKWGLAATGNQDDLGNGIATDGHGGISVCGTWNDEITFNVELDANGGNNLFLAHLNDIHFSVSASRKQSDWTPFGPVCANSGPVDLTTTHIPLQAGPGAAVQSSNGVALPDGALGLQPGGEALFDNNGDRVTIDMGAAAIVPAGQNLLMRWRRSSGTMAATAHIEVSMDALSFTSAGSFQTNSSTHGITVIPVPIATRYVRITRMSSTTNFSVDGVFQDMGTEPGGVWSGAGVSGTSFDPSGLSGPVQITYTVSASSTTHAVQVDALSSTGTLTAPNSGIVCPNGGTTVSLSGATATTNTWSTSINGG
ncbi:MAG TPA: discoidin domain-containing protein, partial [Flavobacteriales bacterium]